MNDLVVSKTHDLTDEAAGSQMPVVTAAGDSALTSRLMLQYQIAAARPRSPSRVRNVLLEIVTMDPDSAQESMYALPRAGKPITGPSIRFAEALKQAWGNCAASSEVRLVNREEKYVESIGYFTDFETNTVTDFRHQRSIAGRNGTIFSNDMIRVTANAASSIAMREAILKGIPKPVWRAAYEAVQKTISGDVMTLTENREKAIRSFAVYGVKPEQIFSAIGINGELDVTLEHIAVLRGMFSALKNGEETVESMFKPNGKEVSSDPDFNPLLKAKEKIDSTTGEVTTGAAGDGQTDTEAQRTAQDKSPAHASSEQSQASEQEPETSGSGTSQADASRSSQPDLLSNAAPSLDSKGEASAPGQTDGADGVGDATPSASDRLRSYAKALAGINDGGPPKLVKMSAQWTTKFGVFTGADESKRVAIYNAHLGRLTGTVTAEACKTEVERIIG